MVKRSDDDLKSDLVEILDTIPAVKRSDIEVVVDGGMVTLNGQVDTHQTRFHVERMARRVRGLRGLQMNVRPRVVALRKHINPPGAFRS